jgi:hypothetical protein
MESAIANRPPRPSFPRKRESRNGGGMLDSRLRGNDGYFDRLVLKKRGWCMKAWPDTKLRSIGSQYSSLTCQDFSHF